MAASRIRQIRIDGNLAYIPLTRGFEAIIDADDVPLVSQWNWCAIPTKTAVYAARGERKGGTYKNIFLHRFLMSPDDEQQIDHINCDTLDNRRCNLRYATLAENNRNQRIAKNNTSGYKGVTFEKRRGVWRASIAHDGHRYRLGSFPTAEAAAAAYNEASAKLHGNFGRIA